MVKVGESPGSVRAGRGEPPAGSRSPSVRAAVRAPAVATHWLRPVEVSGGLPPGAGRAPRRCGWLLALLSVLGCESSLVLPGQPPPVRTPVGLVVEAGDGAARLRWQIAPGPPVDGFRVYARVELPGPPWERAILVEGATTATLVGLPNDHAVWVAVGAVVGGQEGPTTPPVVVTPRRDGGARVLVPAGAVLLGRNGGLSHEGPAHHVYLDAFWIDRYPATNAELRACVDAGACPRPARPESFISGTVMVADYFDDPIYDGFPAVALDWQTAADLCDWRGGRLPTEAEWEAAAGPGPHPWGDAPPACALANFDDDGHLCVGGIAPVGSWPGNESPAGARDMVGNLWQWTADWWAPDAYRDVACRNPRGPETGTERVLRGGAWYYGPEALAVTYRNHWEPVLTFSGDPFGDTRAFGVRCVYVAAGLGCDPLVADCLPEGPCVDVAALDPPRSIAADAGPADAGSSGDDGGCTEPLPAPDVVACAASVAAPACPSGWPVGCDPKPCACCQGVVAKPPVCAEPSLAVTVGWRDGAKTFHPLEPGGEVEICEGFQGGTHLGIALRLELPGVESDSTTVDVRAVARSGETPVGCLLKDQVAVTRDPGGTFTSGALRVLFEACGGPLAEQQVTLELRVSHAQGEGYVHLLLTPVDAAEGPFTAAGDGC